MLQEKVTPIIDALLDGKDPVLQRNTDNDHWQKLLNRLYQVFGAHARAIKADGLSDADRTFLKELEVMFK